MILYLPTGIQDYQKDIPTKAFVRKLMGLAFLPAEQMETGLQWLENDDVDLNDLTRELLGWYRMYWVNRWTRKCYSVFQRTI